MGNSCAKGPPREADEDGEGTEKAGFRDRRLSVSQVPSEKGSPNRRLSVYNEDTEPAAEVLAEIASVAVKSVDIAYSGFGCVLNNRIDRTHLNRMPNRLRR